MLKAPECFYCNAIIKLTDKKSELRLNTTKGIKTYNLCSECSILMDKMNELQNRKD